MQLINMEVDRHGNQQRCFLGPFSPGLNAVCGPRGSGKTTLLSWLRQVAAERYGNHFSGPQWSLPLSGSLEITNLGKSLRAVNYQDGRTDYRGGLGYSTDHHVGSYGLESSQWLSPLQREALSGLIATTGAADTEIELSGLARRLGVDIGEYAHQTPQLTNEQLRNRQADLARQIRDLDNLSSSREELLAKRDALESELIRLRDNFTPDHGTDSDLGRLEHRHSSALEDLQSTNSEIASIDTQIAQRQADLKLIETNNCVVEVTQSYREQLQDIDDRLGRWRRTLKDLRAHRQRIEYNATDARLDEQVGDQLSPTKDADPRGALRALEASILTSRKQLDEVVGRLGNEPLQASSEYEVVRGPGGETRLVCTDARRQVADTSALPALLRSMQKDLYDVCQQLSRHQSQEAREKLSTQSQQLQRAENELLASIDKLIDERATLLRTIAAQHDLSLDKLTVAEGQWSQAADHPNLQQWLLQEENSRQATTTGASSGDRQRLLEEIESLRARRRELQLHADHCKSQLRDSKDYRLNTIAQHSESYSPTVEAEIQSQISRITDELNRFASRDQLQDELRSVERQLGMQQPTHGNIHSSAVNAHIKAMMGRVSLSYADRRSQRTAPRQYDPVDGVISEGVVEYETYEAAVPGVIVRLAQRLAIAEGLAARGEPVSLLLDEVVDQVSPELRGRVVSHLAIVAQRGQQIILLSADEHIAQLVRQNHGWVGYMQFKAAAENKPVDLNRELAAYANEETTDMWQRAEPPAAPATKPYRNEYFLTNESLIEDLPSIDASYADRCRSVGIDLIGDLRKADSAWLAEQIEAGPGMVARWQSEASLLCTVRNLRPFDARVLVGAGIRSGTQLSQTQPGKLLARVEDFLATERGRRILSTGSRYELSRMTDWIAAAKGSSTRHERVVERYESEGSSSGRSSNRSGARTRTTTRRRRRSSERSSEGRQYGVVGSRSSRSESRSSSGSKRSNASSESSSELKFYLHLSSPVVDAPTIGPSMASKLEKCGVYTVRDLLDSDPEQLAEQLDHRRVDADEVASWQIQSQLVCRIPHLRGHDSQMLAACEINSPEELASMDASDVLSVVLEFAQSGDGQRILRGSKEPDLDEVNDWIAWAGLSRALNAA
ncbi:MAG: hypothetical protein Aurels2KO_44540 [Aureliella sp.]